MAKGPGGEFTVTGGRKTLATGLGVTTDRPLRQLSIKAPASNVGDISFGGSTVGVASNREGLITPGGSYTWGPTCSIRLTEIWVVGPGTSEKILVNSEKE